jgi:hypothetical protein
MAYTYELDNDVFLSYAHADDEDDWVKQFAKRLKQELERQVEAEVAVWSDRSLPQHGVLEESLTAQVRRSALLLIVLSDSSAKSDWCQREIQKFSQANGDAALRRLFIVQKEPVTDWPSSLLSPDGKKLLYYNFLDEDRQDPLPINVPSGAIDPRASKKIRQLCRDLKTALFGLREQGKDCASEAFRVFLAPTPNDEPERSRLIEVLEREHISFRNIEGESALQELEDDQSELFVQVLGASNPFGLPSRLLEKARNSAKKLLLWLEPGVKIEDVRGTYGELLRRVRANGILPSETFEQFADRVVAQARVTQGSGSRLPCFVALRMTPDDREYASQFKDFLSSASQRLKIRPLLVNPDIAPSETYKNELGANGFVFVWGRAMFAAANSHLDLLFEDGPPPNGNFDAESLACFDPKKPFEFPLRRDVTLIECYSDADQARLDGQLQRFVKQLETAIDRRNGPLWPPNPPGPAH